jgi:hypothetical protein
MPQLKVTLGKTKETPGTNVYTAPKMNAEGKPNATTSIYLNKEALGGQPAPATINVTIDF